MTKAEVTAAPHPLPAGAPKLAASSALTRGQLALALGLAVGHVVLAVLMRAAPQLATAHAVACLLIGLVVAGTTRRMGNVAAVAGYIVGCEVLWRMSKATVFWEFGKYALASVMLVALVRIGARRNRVLAIACFALLIPSVALTFVTLDLDAARQEVSFNLAGPFALTISVLFFSNIRLTASQLLTTFLALVAPVIGIGALTFLSTAAQDQIEFVNAANNVTSGGYGPNQVSAMLGLAMMFLFLLLLVERKLPWSQRVPLFVLAAALATQAALTFARGGIVLAFAGTAAAMFVLLRGNRRGRATVVVVAIISILLGKYVIEPRLDELTGGELSQRYSNTKSSGRDLFIISELALFEEHPILGVGPGIGMRERQDRGLFYGASHTEYTRVLAEHGIFGVGSLVCFFALCARAVRKARDTRAKALAAAMVIWVVLFLLVYGTRLAAPAFVFGLAFARRPDDPSTSVAVATRVRR